MRCRLSFVCFAIFVLSAAVRAAEPVPEFAPTTGEPFAAPIFNPPGTLGAVPPPKPEPLKPKPPESIIFAPSLFDSTPTTGADPFALPPSQELSRAASDLVRCPPEFFTWYTAEWLIGSTRGASLVPILTTGPASAGALAGSIGQPATFPLFGGKPVLNDWRSGFRGEAGVWFDPDHRSGASVRFYSLFSRSEQSAAQPTGMNVVNVPNFVPNGTGAAQIPIFVAFPGMTTGTATAQARTSFTGGDINYRRLLGATDSSRFELLVGYRQLHLWDSLGADFTATPIDGSAAVRVSGIDSVRTENNFFGPQLGLYGSTGWNRLILEGHAAGALGVTVSDLEFARARVLGANGGPGIAGPGLPDVLAASVNQLPLGVTSARGTLTYFGLVAEGGLRAKWSVTDHVRLTGGYSFLYWNNVRRAPEMFTDSAVLRPRAVEFTAHLFSAGLELRY